VKPVFMIVVASVAHAAVASAQPAGAQAEVLFHQGKELLAKGQIAEACAAFDASEKLDPTTSTVLNQANCRETNGQFATAWGLFLEAERLSRAGSDEGSRQMHAIAAARAAQLEPRLSTLRINVARDVQVGGLEVLRDQERVDIGAWNEALPIDGGSYRIVARAPGNAEWSTTVNVAAERDAKTIDIPRLQGADLGHKRAPAAPAPSTGMKFASADPAPGSNDDDEERPRPSSGPPKWLPLAIGGGALALLGSGLTVELVAESTDRDANAAMAPAKQTSLLNSANHERYAAIGLAAGGVAAGGVAVWLLFRDRRDDRDGVAVAPIATGDRVGISITGGF